MAEKNMVIALILSFFITGLGLVYDGLYIRWIASFIIAIILTVLSYSVSGIFSLIGILWTLYLLYDTYVCTNAINNNQAIPKFLTQFDLE